MKEFDQDHAFDVYIECHDRISDTVRESLKDKSVEIQEYVIERLSDEFRFYFIMEDLWPSQNQ